MRFLSMLLLILLSTTAFAADEGEKTDVDGQKFTHKKGVWVHDALGDSYTVSDKYTTVHKDKRWNKWYREGSPTLKKIMDLGQNVVFSYKGSDSMIHTYGVFESTKIVKKAIAGGSAAIASGLGTSTTVVAGTVAATGSGGSILGLPPVAAAAIGGGVVVGAVIINSDSDNNETSESKR